MTDYAARDAALSRKFRQPVHKRPSQEYCNMVDEQGNGSMLWISGDKKTVMKTPEAWHLDGCTDNGKAEYEGFERESREFLEREKEIYQHLGNHEGLLPYLSITDLGIVFPYMKNGNLRQFLTKLDEDMRCALRFYWIKSALTTFIFIHGKGVIQADVSTRNFLVSNDLSLLLCDFAGSKIGDKKNLVRPETCYEKFHASGRMPISIETEIFAIGSLIYEISTGKKPYDEKTDEEVESLFMRNVFPDTGDVLFGSIVKKCWYGEFESASEVLKAFLETEKSEE